ncbi:RNAse III [Altererythrobacter xiamenensis]|uniref:Ribonuclease 3 n=1 Tax=Altererythrobacter xiamenensis TaxID=1316679 RepID=A0A1Y6FH35_9SPHN|nr:ribonuclease III [Altererythrobacter xiamenensis]SMQ74165.1 RNAse III [Altererythrobacter xiamenensis]
MSTLDPETLAWLNKLGFEPQDHDLWLAALTHGSHDADVDYERLEFLGDRVLGLCMADWLYRHNNAPEGKLSQRLNALVSRETCARIARKIELGEHIRMGKQARDDGGLESTNILGDVVEAMLGAGFLDCGFEPICELVHEIWSDEFNGDTGEAKHPKSALQEWAAGNQRKPPMYEVIDRSGPDHAAQFTVKVSVHKVGEAQATASNKQEAEKRAAKAFMERFG